MNGIEVLLQLKDKLTSGLQGAENKLAQMATKMKAHAAQINTAADNIWFSQVKAMKAAQSEIPGFSRLMDVATNKYVLMGTGAVAVGATLIKASAMAEAWDTKMAELNVTMQKTPEELKKVSDHLLNLGTKYPVALDNIPIALNKIVSAGVEYSQAMKVLEPTLMASKAGFVDVGVAAQAAVGFMASSGIKDATQAWDMLFAAQNAGNVTMEALAQYMPQLVPVLKQAGFQAFETAGAFAYMTTQGINADRATTQLAALGRAFTDTTVTDKFKAMKINIFNKDGSVKELNQIVALVSEKTKGMSDQAKSKFMSALGLNGEASAALGILQNDMKKLNDITAQVKDSGGALADAYNNSRTPLDNMIILANQFKIFMINIGHAVNAVIAPALNFVVNHLDSIKTTLKWIGSVALGAASAFIIFKTVMIGIVAVKKIWTFITSGLTLAIKGLNAAFAANPFGFVITIIGALVGAFMYLWNTSEGFRSTIYGIWETIKTFFGNLPAYFMGIFKGAWEVIKSFFKNMWDGFQNLSKGIGKIFMGIGKILIGAITFDKAQIKEGSAQFMDGLKQGFDGDINAMPLTNAIANGKKYAGAFGGAFANETKDKWKLGDAYKWGKLKGQQSFKEDNPQEDKSTLTNGTIPKDPNKKKKDDDNDKNLSTSSVTETGGQAKSIVINIGTIKSADTIATSITKGTTNSDIENTIMQSIYSALRNIELSYN